MRYTFGAIGISLFSVWLIRHTRLSSIVDNWVLEAKKIFSGEQAVRLLVLPFPYSELVHINTYPSLLISLSMHKSPIMAYQFIAAYSCKR